MANSHRLTEKSLAPSFYFVKPRIVKPPNRILMRDFSALYSVCALLLFLFQIHLFRCVLIQICKIYLSEMFNFTLRHLELLIPFMTFSAVESAYSEINIYYLLFRFKFRQQKLIFQKINLPEGYPHTTNTDISSNSN